MAKIEKPQAVNRLAEIIDLADALMVARGDLGVEMPLEKVPAVQKQMTRASRVAGKPVVVATQMLESMINSPLPTRAEVSMSPRRFTKVPTQSCCRRNSSRAVPCASGCDDEPYRGGNRKRPALPQYHRSAARQPGGDRRRRDRDRARHIADTLTWQRSIRWTSSGSTGLRVARERPRPAIVALSPNIATGRRLAVVWGVHCVVTEDAHDQDDMVDRACRIAFKEGFAKPGQRVIIVAGVPLGTPGATNMLRIAYVGAETAGD